LKVVDVDQTLGDRAVSGGEVEAAYAASAAVNQHAPRSGLTVPLMPGQPGEHRRAFEDTAVGCFPEILDFCCDYAAGARGGSFGNRERNREG
jgi:hypothetical protein